MSGSEVDTSVIRQLLANPTISKELFDELQRRLDVLEGRG